MDGNVHYTSGMLPTALYARSCDAKLIASLDAVSETLLIGDDIDVLPVCNLMNLVNVLQGVEKVVMPKKIVKQDSASDVGDFADVKG